MTWSNKNLSDQDVTTRIVVGFVLSRLWWGIVSSMPVTVLVVGEASTEAASLSCFPWSGAPSVSEEFDLEDRTGAVQEGIVQETPVNDFS